ncbi:MAG: 4Fe-4S dicluster domain-containing protein [Clostridiales bacterium]|nr:4Fe-4S dicluster domain-containing protein [Clostridiales bacterium]MBE5747626.1 4Fe-4S dicluster domain-containing protein [Clostridiales bacterium]
MIDIQEKEKCSGCHACLSVCPKNCITMMADAEGFLYPHVNEEACLRCGKCTVVCPILNAKLSTEAKKPKAYAAINRQEQVRRTSSSGGVFFALAIVTIQKGGVVFGACIDDNRQVVHTFIENEADIGKLMGSKYVQSTVGQTYLQAKQFLSMGREVLFVGTPCQIGGLRAFLGKEYPNLCCVDIVCHGVPSPKVWDKYVRYQEKKYGAVAQRISFRDKCTGWRAYSMKMEFSNGEIYQKLHEDDAYMRLFLSDVCLRPSCHDCHFKGLNRNSDITLADCWGAERVLNQEDDDKGISLILIHSDKGMRAFAEIEKDCDKQEVDIDKAIRENPSAIKSTVPHKKRISFFAEIEKISLSKATKKYAPYQRSMKENLAKLLKKIGVWKLIKK